MTEIKKQIKKKKTNVATKNVSAPSKKTLVLKKTTRKKTSTLKKKATLKKSRTVKRVRPTEMKAVDQFAKVLQEQEFIPMISVPHLADMEAVEVKVPKLKHRFSLYGGVVAGVLAFHLLLTSIIVVTLNW